jgi:hypothetical protein
MNCVKKYERDEVITLVVHKINMSVVSRGIFVTENAGTSFRKLSGRKPERRSGTLFPGIGITNTIPLRPIFLSLCAFRNLFFKKNSAGFSSLC